MKKLKKEMNRMFKEFDTLSKQFENIKFDKENFRQPLIDLKETDSELIASVEIPGVNKEDIQLKVTEDSLEIKVERKQEVKIQKENYFKAERAYRGFYRKVILPVKIIPEKTKANYKDGILEIIMQKAEEKKIKKERKIEVK
ncbi:MAG: Hsp20/alpha crystallin family protein [Candidatus Aenigmatarchaeota archaeon]